MPAYAVGRMVLRDRSWVEEYNSKIQAILEKFHGRYLAKTIQMEHLEGDLPLPTLMVIVEFPSRDDAKAFFQSEEYAPLLQLRRSGADMDIVMFDGL